MKKVTPAASPRTGFRLSVNAMLLLAFLVVTAAMAISACTYRKEELPDLCDTANLRYSTGAIQTIVTTKCAISNCHLAGTTASGDFSDYSQLKAAVTSGAFNQRVFVDRDMPQTGSLTPCEYEQLQAWADAGAPE